MRSDWVISGSLHAAVLLLALVTIASSKPTHDLSNFVPVSIVTGDVSHAALGQENAPKPAKSKPLAEKLGDTKPVDQLAPKVVDKPAISTAASVPAPQPKPAPKPERKTAKKPEKHTDEFKADKIAELLSKSQSPKPRDKPAHEMPKYNANQIAALLDHREPQRRMAAANALNETPSLGAPTAAPDAQLSQSEIDALIARIRECWSPPPGIDSNSNIYVAFRVLFRPDGSLAQMPVVVEGSASPLGPALAESGKRALLLCQPYTMLKPEHYAQWRDITVDFSPRELSRN